MWGRARAICQGCLPVTTRSLRHQANPRCVRCLTAATNRCISQINKSLRFIGIFSLIKHNSPERCFSFSDLVSIFHPLSRYTIYLILIGTTQNCSFYSWIVVQSSFFSSNFNLNFNIRSTSHLISRLVWFGWSTVNVCHCHVTFFYLLGLAIRTLTKTSSLKKKYR